MLLALLLAGVAAGAATTAPAVPEPVDEAAFRDGLRRRGLTVWLDEYLRETPPVDEIDAQLRQREQILAQLDQAELSETRREAVVAEAGGILDQLITKHPNHPDRLRWHLEWAKDDLERRAPSAFDRLLLYDLPGRDRSKVADLSGRAAEHLERLRQELAKTWASLAALDEASLESLKDTGSLAVLEALDAQATMLSAWTNLYRALSSEAGQSPPSTAWSELLTEVTQRNSWLELPAGHEVEQCGALVMAAVAARHLGQFDRADQYSRRVVEVISQVADRGGRHRLRRAALLAVIEQIRAMRDAGKIEAAAAAVEQARQWSVINRPGEGAPLAALALLESTIEARKRDPASGSPASQPLLSRRPFTVTYAIEPLQRFAAQSGNYRDLLYGVVAPVLTSEQWDANAPLFEQQLLLGAAVADAMANGATPGSPMVLRLQEAMAAAEKTLASVPSTISSEVRGEWLFLLGRAHYLLGKRLEAARVLADLVEQIPRHERADLAVREAAAIAQEELRQIGGVGSPGARAALIRAGHLLRQRAPDDPRSKRLQYYIAAALEVDGRLEEAAREYAAVSADDSNSLEAALGRIRCWRNLLQLAAANRTLDEAGLRSLADKAVAAGREVAETVRRYAPAKSSRPAGEAGPDRHCLAADVALLLANLLNHPSVQKSVDALTTLKDFEAHFGDCPGALGPALRERIVALRQLKRLGEARAVVDRFLETDSQGAGPVMAALLEAMRGEIEAAADRGDHAASTSIAGEAVQLGRLLLDWADKHPGSISPEDRLTIRLWLAWSLLYADQPTEAQAAFEECEEGAGNLLPAGSAARRELQLGRAQSLLKLNQPAEALPLFGDVWQQVPERSPAWWQAFVGSLACHQRLGSSAPAVLESIRQQRFLSPDLGGPRWKRQIEAIEQAVAISTDSTHSQPG